MARDRNGSKALTLESLVEERNLIFLNFNNASQNPPTASLRHASRTLLKGTILSCWLRPLLPPLRLGRLFGVPPRLLLWLPPFLLALVPSLLVLPVILFT